MELLQHYFDSLTNTLAMFDVKCPINFEVNKWDYLFYNVTEL